MRKKTQVSRRPRAIGFKDFTSRKEEREESRIEENERSQRKGQTMSLHKTCRMPQGGDGPQKRSHDRIAGGYGPYFFTV